MYVLLRDEEGRKKEARKVIQITQSKQRNTSKAVTFLKKNELPRVGLEPTTLPTLDRALYHTLFLSLKAFLIRTPEIRTQLLLSQIPY